MGRRKEEKGRERVNNICVRSLRCCFFSGINCSKLMQLCLPVT